MTNSLLKRSFSLLFSATCLLGLGACSTLAGLDDLTFTDAQTSSLGGGGSKGDGGGVHTGGQSGNNGGTGATASIAADCVSRTPLVPYCNGDGNLVQCNEGRTAIVTVDACDYICSDALGAPACDCRAHDGSEGEFVRDGDNFTYTNGLGKVTSGTPITEITAPISTTANCGPISATATGICASGVLARDSTGQAKASIGLKVMPLSAIGSIEGRFSGDEIPSTIRVEITTAQGNAYCSSYLNIDHTFTLSSFYPSCEDIWGTGESWAYTTGDEIVSVTLVLPSSTGDDVPFDVCLDYLDIRE